MCTDTSLTSTRTLPQKLKKCSHYCVNGYLGLNREKLIVLAYLLGSDYTEGLEGDTYSKPCACLRNRACTVLLDTIPPLV